MLSYAFTTLNQGGYEDIATEEFENIHNLLAAILAKGIGRQLKQGLYREYLNQKETVTAVRGKIDIPGTIQNRLARRQVLTCEYDELSENNLLNQILKTTVMLLLCHARVDQAYKSDLKKEMLFFSNVDTIDPTAIRWSAIRFQRNNNTYRMLISFCQLILEGMLLTSDSGDYRLASFIDEQRMNRLYEKFILEYNLLIMKAEERYWNDLRLLKETVRNALNRAERREFFSDAQDSTSCLTALLHFKDTPNVEFSFDVAIIKKNPNGNYMRLIHNKPWNQYTWNEVPRSHQVKDRADEIKKEGLWQEVRDKYLEKKNMYLSWQDHNHPSFVVYVEAVNEVYNRYFNRGGGYSVQSIF